MPDLQHMERKERRSPDIRIAMWSGPRTISTALMRSWDARGDTFVCDEPLYAHYLAATDTPHPGRDEIVEQCETDWRRVATWLSGPVPNGKSIFYQKHMAHHLLPGMSGDWMSGLRHAFLIRDPEEMLISLSKVMPEPRMKDTGLPQQLDIFRRTCETAHVIPPVIDARDVLENPGRLLARLCRALGVEFSTRMLSWRAGPRTTDGVWAPYWYANVESSTCFKAYKPPTSALPSHLRALEQRCRTCYDELYRHRLTA